jgi:hypothetical protein
MHARIAALGAAGAAGPLICPPFHANSANLALAENVLGQDRLAWILKHAKVFLFKTPPETIHSISQISFTRAARKRMVSERKTPGQPQE